MHHTLALKNKLAYARFLHLLFMFVVAMLFFLFSNLPHAWWILAITLTVSSSIEPGIIVGISAHRVQGTFFGLLILLLLLYILQVNYRLIPVVFICVLIGYSVASLNFRRYDITVFFSTLSIIFLVAQTTDIFITPEGPIEVVVNRGLSTIIGMIIVFFADYVLFNSYHYAQKLYLFHQMNVYNFSRDIVNEICDESAHNTNKFFLIIKLRSKTNEVYRAIATSAASLKFDLESSEKMKQQVDHFQTLIWELRRIIFALCFSELILTSKSSSALHLVRYHQLMAEVHKNFIKIEK